MNKIFVNELKAGEFVQSTFLVSRHELRRSRTGELYLRLTLEDRTGSIEGRVWSDPEALASRVTVDDFAAVRGEVVAFGEDIHIEIGDLERVPDTSIQTAHFFELSRWPADEMLEQLRAIVANELRSEPIRAFLGTLLDDEELVARFKVAPAAMSNHHAYRGGLLEHCLSMTRVALRLGAHYGAYYPGLINVDLVVAGVILHDFAKIWELSYRRNLDYTTEGRLIGHIPMGAKLVGRIASRCKRTISEDLRMHLEHLVLSHHGELEFGSPTKPKTPEAFLLHNIDMIDSRMNMLWNEMQAARRPDAGESWSEFRRSLGDRILFRGRNSVDWDLGPELSGADLAGPGLPTERAAKRSPSDLTLNLFDDQE